jgi:hypothetical protein
MRAWSALIFGLEMVGLQVIRSFTVKYWQTQGKLDASNNQHETRVLACYKRFAESLRTRVCSPKLRKISNPYHPFQRRFPDVRMNYSRQKPMHSLLNCVLRCGGPADMLPRLLCVLLKTPSTGRFSPAYFSQFPCGFHRYYAVYCDCGGFGPSYHPSWPDFLLFQENSSTFHEVPELRPMGQKVSLDLNLGHSEIGNFSLVRL